MPTSRHPLAPIALAATLTVSTLAGQLAFAQASTANADATYTIDLLAQPLGQSLHEFTLQTGLQLLVRREWVEGRSAPALKGRLSAHQALDKLLAGSDLSAVVDGNTVVLQKRAASISATTPTSVPVPDKALPALTVTGTRSKRVSKGATGLPMAVKETPQSITTFDADEMAWFGVTEGNKALQMVTGLNVEQYETNRATYNSRGYEIQLTQIDGLGMTNSWGTVVGQQDTYLYDKIEVIRGANALLTGVGNASGTVNYVRKRPKNVDGGELSMKLGAFDTKRVALDQNKVLTEDGATAARLVLIHEDKASHIRNLRDRNSTVYGVIDTQIGRDGVLTAGITHQDAKQKSPMWGSLTLNYLSGKEQLALDTSASTSVDWAYWNTKTTTAFVEYRHLLDEDWEAKLTYTKRKSEEQTKLLYAYALSGGLNDDNTGLYGWPYRSYGTTDNDLLDANLQGHFQAFGRQHDLIVGLSHALEHTETDTYSYNASYLLQPLPALAYGGSAYAEPDWTTRSPASGGNQALTRLYAASTLSLSDELRAILGLNAIRLSRDGSSRYGSVTTTTTYPDTTQTTPYLGFTYALTPEVTTYVSYSEIVQNQDQTDASGAYLDPMTGVNHEIGVKSDWFDKRLLTSVALFSAQQKGLATYEGMTSSGAYYYVPKDVKSTGVEVEANGRIGQHARLGLGLTHLKLTGPDGKDIYEWVPRTMVKLRFDSALPALPALRLGMAARWQSDVYKTGGARQDAYLVADASASYAFNPKLTGRVHVNNVFNQTYLTGIAYGALYGAPRSAFLSLDYKL